jgi:hypothetical protein
MLSLKSWAATSSALPALIVPEIWEPVLFLPLYWKVAIASDYRP